MTTFEALTVVLVALTLVATVWGWSVTARNQKELLDKQLEATDRLTKLPLRSARRADQFSKIAAWAVETEKLLRQAGFLQNDPSRKDDLTAKFIDWETSYFTENLQTAQFLDQELANAMRKYYGYSDLFIIYALNGHLNALMNPLWNTEIAAAKDAFAARLRELDKTIVEQ